MFLFSCALTPAVSKASAGAMETLPVFTTNIKELLKVLLWMRMLCNSREQTMKPLHLNISEKKGRRL
jgi:tRNA G18 (ribose-2'-O)-methylase SpoU